ncbi:alpha-L-fucosidase [Marinoscillum furvescens]|nr:alpha-L-fucosidase [Marinoscillum furvescens]
MSRLILFVGLAVAVWSCTAPMAKEVTNEEEITYEPTWESLARHNAAPEWFKDSKFGIYFHWGVYSVPAFGSEWYPYRLYRTDAFPEYKQYHEKKYGKLEEFGYHDFIPMFKAEQFDAEDWAELFKKSGAQFAGPVAQHHDGFAMWDSEINPWNAADMGPQKDITGEMLAALKKRGLKTITSFHHARLRQRHEGNPEKWDTYNSHFAYHPDYPTSSEDPDLRKFYGNMPQEEFDQYWLDQVNEVVDKYSPDMLWYDVWLNHVSEDKIKEMAAYYLNHTQKTGQEGVLIAKHDDLPKTMSVLDIEQGGKKDVSDEVWMTDVTISDKGSWCFTEGQVYKTPEMIVRNMIDVWSKNGVVLFNISPKADGTINKEQRDILLSIGEWMDVYGEAVYGTVPFHTYGFGMAKAADGKHGGQSAKVEYSASDVRFTCSKDKKSMYVFLLGKPEAGKEVKLKLNDIGFGPASPVKQITELKSGKPVVWEKTERYYTFTVPNTELSPIANVFKMELE